jgi:hypothetical protein
MCPAAQQAAQHALSDLGFNGFSSAHALDKKGASMTDVALSHDQVVDIGLCLNHTSHRDVISSRSSLCDPKK